MSAGAQIAQIGFGTVRHRRLRPAQNQFAYPAYFLRLPMRRLTESLSAVSRLSHNRFNWFGFHDADHGGSDGLHGAEWIDRVLADAGVTDATGEIWLHTFARVLGYVFNPVSFWYCHRNDGALRAVLCEVNNTFGERHCYLLAHADGRPLSWGEEVAALKVFHVSPFCAIEGAYRFRFVVTEKRCIARIDYDDAQGLLIETSIAGALEPLTDRALARAFWRYPLFTLTVVGRIHWQALRLFFLRLPFFSKPPRPTAEVTQ